MSELKARRAYFSEDDYDKGVNEICAKVSDCGYDRKNDWWSYAFEDEVYLKSEADKVIAELERDIVKLKSSLKYLVVRGLIDGPVKKAVEDLLKEVEDAH